MAPRGVVLVRSPDKCQADILWASLTVTPIALVARRPYGCSSELVSHWMPGRMGHPQHGGQALVNTLSGSIIGRQVRENVTGS